jgi:hypothetical protein
MHRNERFGRGRGPRRRADEGRFGSEGWRGGSGQGFDQEGGGRFWNRGEYGRGHGGEDYRGMSRGGYPGYGAGDAGWGGGYPGYGEEAGHGRGPHGLGQGWRDHSEGDQHAAPGWQGWPGGPHGEPGGRRDQGFGYGRGEQGKGFQGGWGEGEFGRTAQENQRHHNDEDYHHWRNEQLRKFDQDYDEWRNERRQKFTEDFNKWRSSRPERTEGSRTTSQADLKNK